jgi:hypothetical protein
MQLKPGTRLRSQVCSTEIIVVKAPAGDVTLTCGGHPMIETTAEPAPGLSPVAGQTEGSLLGKRYTRGEEDLEVLVTKAGDGTLAADGEILVVKAAKPLPSSD